MPIKKYWKSKSPQSFLLVKALDHWKWICKSFNVLQNIFKPAWNHWPSHDNNEKSKLQVNLQLVTEVATEKVCEHTNSLQSWKIPLWFRSKFQALSSRESEWHKVTLTASGNARDYHMGFIGTFLLPGLIFCLVIYNQTLSQPAINSGSAKKLKL